MAVVALVAIAALTTIAFLRLHDIYDADALNMAGAMAILMPVPLYGILRWRFPPGVAFAGVLMIVLSPIFLSLGTSFHPEIPSLALLAWSVYVFGAAPRVGHRIAGAVLLFASLATRAGGALAIPPLLLVAALADRRAARGTPRILPWAVSAVVVAMIAFLLLIQSVSSQPGSGIWTFTRTWLPAMLSAARAVPRNLPLASLSTGLGALALAVVGMLPLLRGRRPGMDPVTRDSLIGAAALALLVLAFWLPNTVAAPRHFALLVPAVAWIACEAMRVRWAGAPLALMTAAILAANLAIPEALSAAMRLAQPTRSRWPIGTFFSSRQAMGREMARQRGLPALVLCGGAGNAEGPPGPCRGAFIQADWLGYGVIFNALARGGPDYPLVEEIRLPGPSVERTYRVGNVDLTILTADVRVEQAPGPVGDALRAILSAEILSAEAAGRTVAVPHELAAAGILPEPGGQTRRLY